MPSSFESGQPNILTSSPKMLPADPKRFSAPVISISTGPEPQSPPTSPKFSIFDRFLRRGDSSSSTTTMSNNTAAPSSTTTKHAETFPQAPSSTTPRSSFQGRRSGSDSETQGPRRFLSVGSNDRSRSRSRSRDRSRSRSRSPAPRVASINHVGRHGNDWLFGGFSLSRRSSERER